MYAAFFATILAQSSNELLVRTYLQGKDVRQQSINALLQTQDGYVWLATGKGLMRFDGVSFEAFTEEDTPGMLGDNIDAFAMWEDKSGVLWAGVASKGVVRNDHGHFSTLQLQQGPPSLNVSRLNGDASGAIWIYTTGGVSRWQNGHLERMHPELFGADVGVMVHPDDRRTYDFDGMGLWRRTPSGLERFGFGKWTLFPTPPGERRAFEKDVSAIYEDNLHRVWYKVSSLPGRYFCVRDNSLRAFHGLPAGALVSYEDSTGFLWLNDTTSHPARWKAGHLYPLPQMKTPSYLRVLEQPDGTILVGSHRISLYAFRRRLIHSLPTPGILEFGPILFQQHNGKVWVGGSDLQQLELTNAGPALESLRIKPGSWNHISALSEDAQGNLLIASHNHLGDQVLRHGKFRPFLGRGFDNSAIYAMLLSSSGDQWNWYGQPVCTLTARMRPAIQSCSGVEASTACLRQTRTRSGWVLRRDFFASSTSVSSLLTQLHHGAPVRCWQLTKMLREGFGCRPKVMALFGSRVGISGRTILRLDFQQLIFIVSPSTTTLTYGFVQMSVSYEFENAVWNGRIKIHPPSCRSCCSTRVMGFPLPSCSVKGMRGSCVADGSYWFSTSGGIASLCPADFSDQPSSLYVVLEESNIDQSKRIPGATIVLSPDQKDLELHYTALGFKRPDQINFRYRLNGFDPGWISAGTRRFRLLEAILREGDWGSSVSGRGLRRWVGTPW